MKSAGFFVKLKKQKRLQVVEPSTEVAQAYLQKSEKSLHSSKVTFEVGNYEDSVALAYYSMYYSVLAILFRVGVKCENHTAALLLLHDIFAIDNKAIIKAKDERIDKQYYVDFSVTKNEVLEMIRQAEEFNAQVLHFIETFNQSTQTAYRKRAIQLIG